MKFTTSFERNTVETLVKKSRFISTVVPVLSVEMAEDALAEIRERHKVANHNCYAYRVGLGVPVERFSDDGEPSGTAGRPILEVVRRQEVDNVLVVVTRYFGGVLLGASGLCRAYADGASQVLTTTPKLECGLMHELRVTCDYGVYGKLEYALGQNEIEMLDKEFSEHVSFCIVVNAEELENRMAELTEWTNGQADLTVSDARYMGVAPDGSLVRDVWPGDES